MELIIAFICLGGFGAPWYCYIIVFLLWIAITVWRTVLRTNLAKSNQVVSLEVLIANKFITFEATLNDIQSRVRGMTR